MKLRFKVWMEKGGQHVFGRGRARLLKAIDREGSIQAAARKMGLSYRHAWAMLKTSEQRLGRELVERVRGGAGGGGTHLTEEGKKLVRLYGRIESAFQKLLEEQQVALDDSIC